MPSTIWEIVAEHPLQCGIVKGLVSLVPGTVLYDAAPGLAAFTIEVLGSAKVIGINLILTLARELSIWDEFIDCNIERQICLHEKRPVLTKTWLNNRYRQLMDSDYLHAVLLLDQKLLQLFKFNGLGQVS